MSEEKTIKLNEKRYSLRTIAQVIGISEMTVYNRAKRLGLDTKRGLTAQDVKAIRALYAKQEKKCSADELRKELEGKSNDGQLQNAQGGRD